MSWECVCVLWVVLGNFVVSLFYSKRSAMQRLEEQIKPFEGQADPGSVSPLHSLSRRSAPNWPQISGGRGAACWRHAVWGEACCCCWTLNASESQSCKKRVEFSLDPDQNAINEARQPSVCSCLTTIRAERWLTESLCGKQLLSTESKQVTLTLVWINH